MKKNKGITLIALIITIVAVTAIGIVTINAITGEDDLIAHSKNAAGKYQEEQENESGLLQSYLDKMEEIGTGAENKEEHNNPSGDNTEVPDLLKQYILGTDLQGRDATEILDLEEFAFLDDASTIADASTTVTCKGLYGFYQSSETEIIFLIEYESVVYKFDLEMDDESGQMITVGDYGVQEVMKAPTPSTDKVGVGSKVHYDDKDWMVLYENGNEVQMISEDVLKYNGNDLRLGYNDSYLTANDATFSAMPSETETQRVAKVIYSYNKAVETLNLACEEIVATAPSYVTDVRCVGSNQSNKNAENGNMYTSPEGEQLAIWHAKTYNGVGKDTDNNFISDYDRLAVLGIAVGNEEGTEESADYWLASRFAKAYSDEVGFGICNVNCEGYCYLDLWHVNESGAYGDYCENGLRPVVSIDTTKCTFTYDGSNEYFTVAEK